MLRHGCRHASSATAALTTRSHATPAAGTRSKSSTASAAPASCDPAPMMKSVGGGPRRSALPVAAEADDLLDATRAIRVADRRRQQAGCELDPLGRRVRRPRRRVPAALLARHLRAGLLERVPQRGAARGDVAAAAEARGERRAEALAPP